MRVAIIGAGMSGLSLAVALAERGIEVVVHEASDEPPSARTFCSFEVEAHPFEAAVSHRWSRIAVAGESGELERTLADHRYAKIDGPAFVAEALRRLEGEDARLCFGSRVEDPTTLDASHVFDSRPLPTDGALLQQFVGRFVETERPRFEPDRAMLMDFRVDQSRGVHFLYVLPTSETEALIEDTYFTRRPIDGATFERTLDRALEALGSHRVVSTEEGTIPMSTELPPPAPPRVTRIGLAGGVAKPSTGYAFLFAQRHARAIASALAKGEAPPSSVRRPRDRFLDEVFLARLRADPSGAHHLFERLFAGMEGDQLARFLSECARPSDLLRVAAALPIGPFTGEALRTLGRAALGRGPAPL